ncbi:glycosyltransferase family 2 protein [Dinoroseobacter sp. PD6]|uniref:glycosyltransferase family 2 protein n=1 Tax=Dinoroseobacter sp. PD6 TaxID=3028384 RepID=UPI00237BF389|nr:glycosyltransferase family 2 protein [Dinoroseobacter sp. PD6]MDD9716362.1 glycosyltransferase family 2 protein [Dinoroseobacter sp. PD6]
MSVISLQPTRDTGDGLLAPVPRKPAPRPERELLADLLVRRGDISPAERLQAVHMARLQGRRPLEVLVAEGWLAPELLLEARCEMYRAGRIDPEQAPADPDLIGAYGIDWCLTHGILPWRRLSGATVYLVAEPEEFADIAATLPPEAGQPVLAVAGADAIAEAIRAAHAPHLIARAETALPGRWSCRGFRPLSAMMGLVCLSLATAALVLIPGLVTSALMWITLAVLAITMGFKLMLAVACLSARPPPQPPPERNKTRPPLPAMSILVPLLRESEVAEKLLNNLDRLRYPRALLDVLFVVEAEDDVTKNALSQLRLPQGFRMLEVPRGTVQTKPRALNFALPFCRGEIVGIYDAEDRPDPDQLLKVAEGFRHAAPEVACLQGRLDFFNTRFNLIARCFTAEYAGWFGLFLQGLDRLGLPIPLGGTTLFLRRKVLEEVGPWDAHNVTEDADLGMRLYRHGYRVSLIDTVTQEEANVRIWPWIKQRSRWIKGYMATYAVHMRSPRALWRALGPGGFAALQCLFLGSILSALTMPLLLWLWLGHLGAPIVPNAVLATLPPAHVLGPVMLGIEAVNLALWAAGVRAARHRHLWPMLPLLHVYFLMSSIAALKALVELLYKPFYWDKTDHGIAMDVHEPPA